MRHPMLSRLLVTAALLFAAALPALASEASDALKEAEGRRKTVDQIADDGERRDADAKLKEFAERRSKELLAGQLGKMDIAYVGKMLGVAGLHDSAIEVLRKAVADPGQTKYGSHIHAYLIQALIDGGKRAESLDELNKMEAQYAGDKQLKAMCMNVGMALRAHGDHEKAADALGKALQMKNTAALKPLVNSLLMIGRKDAAIETIGWAMEKGGEARSEEFVPLLEITKKVGTKVPLAFDAFAPDGTPEMQGKVVVLGFWNVSARTFKWTLQVLEGIRAKYGLENVVTLGVSTYYKKNPDTGQIEADMTPEREREFGMSYRDQYGYQGFLAYTKDEAALTELGLSGLPYFMVFDREGTLVWTHTVNPADDTDVNILRAEVAKRTGQ